MCRALNRCGLQVRSDLLRAAGAQIFRKTDMRTLILGLVATTSLLGASLAVGAAQADPPAQLISGVYTVGDAPTLQRAQFFFGGRNYCWYIGGWRGPGYYWCGYAWRRGFGWGGGEGWNGWHGRTGGGSRGGSRFSGAGVRNGGFESGGVHGGGVRGASAFGGAGGVHSSGVHSAGASGGGHGGGGHGGSPGGGGRGGAGAGQKRG